MGMTRGLRIGVMYASHRPGVAVRRAQLTVRTNIRHPHKSTTGDTPSRGQLLKGYLAPSPSSSHRPQLEEYLRSYKSQADQYEGFNLLLFDLKPQTSPQVGYLTNRPQATLLDLSPTASTSSTGAQTCGISNSPIDKPFAKVEAGNATMDAELRQWSRGGESQDELVERMMKLLS